MRKILLGILIGLFFGMVATAFSQYGRDQNLDYYEYHYGSEPTEHDVDAAKVNIAIALQKIATNGITLNVVNK